MGLKASFNDGKTLFELITKSDVPKDVPKEIIDTLNMMACRIIGPQEEHNGQVKFGCLGDGHTYFVFGPYSEVIEGCKYEGSFVVTLTAKKKP